MKLSGPKFHFGKWSVLLVGITLSFELGEAARAEFPPTDPVQTSVALEKSVLDAFAAGRPKVTITPGVYHLGTLPNDKACLHFKDIHDLEIDATGVTLIISSQLPAEGIEMDDCKNVILKGATVRHDPVPFSQGKIEVVGPDHKSVDIRIAAGYPRQIDDPKYFFPPGSPKFINIFDPITRELKPRADDLFFDRIERLGPDLIRFHLSAPLPEAFPLSVGDLVAWRGLLMPDIFLIGCEKMQVLGVTLESAAGFTFFEAGGVGGNYYQNCRLIRGPAPEGATEPPLFSSCADAFHSVSMRNGPTLEGCLFEHMNDDGIAIHGVAYLITEAKGNTITVAAAQDAHPYYCNAGDTIRLYDETGVLTAEAKVTAITEVHNYHPPESLADFNEFNAGYVGGTLIFSTMTLDKVLPARFPWFAVDADTQSRHFVVRNCTVRHNRPRGMLIQSGDGTIENCLVEGSTMGGIVVAPDMCYWAEADYARNLIIRNNTIRHVGIWLQMGAVHVACWWKKTNCFVPLPGGHRDILIEGNTFDHNDGVNVLVSSAQHVVVQNNQFIEPMGNDTPALFGIFPGSLLWFTQSSDVSVKGNVVKNPGPFMKAIVKTSSTVSDFKDQQDSTAK